jgi:hypothetical protein
MELLIQWSVGLLKTIPALFLNPFTYLGIMLVVLSWRRQQVIERKLFGTRLHRPEDVLPRQLGSGLCAGLLLSFLLVLFGVVISPNAIFILWVLVLLFGLLGVRYLSFAYAGSVLAVLSLVARHFPAPKGDWAEWLWTSLQSVHLPSLFVLIALLHLTQAVLLALGKTEDMSPVWTRGKRGKTVGGYQWQPVWFVPLFVVAESGEFLLPFWPAPFTEVQAVDALYPSWPLLAMSPELVYGFALLPGLISYSAHVIVSSPRDYLRYSAKWLSIYAMVLLVISVGTMAWEWLSIVALLFAVAGYDALFWVLRYREQRGQPAYVHPAHGLKILAVIPGTPAAKMGLKPGEVVVKVNGCAVRQSGQLYQALSKNKAFCKLEVLNAEGESKFPQCSLYEDDHHQLGLILAPDDQGVSWRKTVLMD